MAENTFNIPSESNLSREQLPYLESELQIDLHRGNKEHKSYDELKTEEAAEIVEATPEVPATPDEYMLAVGERLEYFRNLRKSDIDLAA